MIKRRFSLSVVFAVQMTQTGLPGIWVKPARSFCSLFVCFFYFFFPSVVVLSLVQFIVYFFYYIN